MATDASHFVQSCSMPKSGIQTATSHEIDAETNDEVSSAASAGYA
ncbi:hypothetical protein WOC68_13230 [Staphylococcus aureus]